MSALGYWYELINVLTRKEISVRYKSSLLGYFWSVLHPLAFGLIYYVVFREIMRVPVNNYPLFLLCGLFPWQWASTAMCNAPAIFQSNAAIIRRVPFPRGVLPVSLVLMEGIHFICALPVIVLIIVLNGELPSFAWLWGIPLLWLLQSLLLTGISWILASITPFLRDLERFTALGIMALFYATPVLYPPHIVPARWHWVLQVNPLSTLIASWRDLLMTGHLAARPIVLSLAEGLLSLLVGFLVLRRLSPHLAEVL